MSSWKFQRIVSRIYKTISMTQSFIRLSVHAVWSTKFRKPLIHESVEKEVHRFIAQQFWKQECPIKIVNGMPDHVHCLFLLSRERSIADVIKQVKGSSSYFINKNNLTHERFAWQIGYAAYSVSDCDFDRVYRYIANQKQHHS